MILKVKEKGASWNQHCINSDPKGEQNALTNQDLQKGSTSKLKYEGFWRHLVDLDSHLDARWIR